MSEIPLGEFGPSKCALGAFVPTSCGTAWEKWCRHCNLVFCAAHVDPVAHQCPRVPKEPLVVPVVEPAPKRKAMPKKRKAKKT